MGPWLVGGAHRHDATTFGPFCVRLRNMPVPRIENAQQVTGLRSAQIGERSVASGRAAAHHDLPAANWHLGFTDEIAGRGERSRRPARRCDRNKLVLTMREPSFEVGLERLAPGLDSPRSILQLILHQVIDAALIHRISCGQFPSFMKCHQRRSGRVGVALHRFGLFPSSIGSL